MGNKFFRWIKLNYRCWRRDAFLRKKERDEVAKNKLIGKITK
jgi:hypothetical protein